MLFDNDEKIINTDSSNYHKSLKVLPEKIEKIFSSFYAPTDNKSYDQIIILCSDQFNDDFDDIKLIFKRIFQIPIYLANDLVGGLSGIPDFSLIVSINHKNKTKSVEKLIEQLAGTNNKFVIINSDFQIATDSLKNQIEFQQIEVLFENSIQFPLMMTVCLALAWSNGMIHHSLFDVTNLCKELREIIRKIDISIPPAKNPAKRLAGQMIDRMIVLIGTDFLKPVAKYWKEQINNVSRTWAQYEKLPGMKVDSINGIYFPEKILSQSLFVFFNSKFLDVTQAKEVFEVKNYYLSSGIGTDEVVARGASILSQIYNTCVFGDYVAYYLSMMYGVDPKENQLYELD